MNNLSFKIYTLGCKVNQYDTNSLNAELVYNGFVEKKKDADIAIINTCSVTRTAVRKDKQTITKARKENPWAKIVVMGCWPEITKKEAEELGVDFIWGVGRHDELISNLSEQEVVSSSFLLKKSERTRYFIKVQDGCEQYCTYCVIPYARGNLKSRNKVEIIKEINGALEVGYKEFCLSGIHLGLYGKDSDTTLNELIKELVNIKNIYRLRLSSIEITEVNNELIEMIKNKDVLCRHLHIPLQSGCDKILKKMNRPYETKYFKDRIKHIRKVVPDIAISSDVIAGFPGESNDDFSKTLNFIKEMNFSRLHVFPFSSHDKAPASRFPDQVEIKVKQKRAEELRELGEFMSLEYRQRFVGKKVPIIIEKIKNDRAIGKSEFYFELDDKVGDNKKIGDILEITIV